MIGAAFKRPIIMFVGLGFPRLLNNAMDALQVLDELPSSYQGPAHGAATKACRAAIAGDIDPETARGVVEAYAKARDLLADVAVSPATLAKSQTRLSA